MYRNWVLVVAVGLFFITGCGTTSNSAASDGLLPGTPQTPAPNPTVTVSVSQDTSALNGGDSQQFQAIVNGTTDQSIVWLVNGVEGGSTLAGIISPSGLYVAPATDTDMTLIVTSRSRADLSKSADAAVMVHPRRRVVTVSISPTALALTAVASQQFQAIVSGATDQSVTWLVNGVPGGSSATGTISNSGLYVAPSTSSQLALSVTARSNADSTKSASATVTVNPLPPPTPPPVTISLAPTTLTLTAGSTQQFQSTVSGATDQSVTWLVSGAVGGTATAGTISPSGLYSAPTTTSQLNVTVTARSNADATVSASAAVTVNPVPPPTVVTISPTTANLASGTTQQFSASVTGPTDQSITWLVNGTIGGSSTNGIISTSGLYSAPTTDSQLNVTVTARSNSDATASANATVTVAPPPSSSSDLYISTTGSDSNVCTQTAPCATFTHVDSVVKPGQTVHVLPGTYNLTSSTCIATAKSGTSSAPITWQSDVYGTAKINGNGACLYIWHATGTYLRIFGFDMTGVQNNNSATLMLSEGAAGNVEVAYNTVHDLNGQFGAAIDMEPYGSSGYTGAPCNVHDNVFFNIAPGTTGSFGRYSIYVACGTNTNIYNNLIYNEASIGIHCWHGANQVHIYNNTIDHANIGILVGTGDGGGQANAYFDVTNNIVTNSGSYGIMAEDSSPATISPTSVFRNNLVYNNPTDWYYNNSGTDRTISSAFSLLGTVAGKDPQFVAPGSGNYHLSVESPAAGVGLQTTYVPALDLSGTSRSNPPAIGAYEH